mmetsp:Transcript_9501/g.11817  ORF Transcript_9501/g.11817 Transcript_9501/m.11817 type:complete len:92 (-) Transcript_9501:1740-2015(-)
MESSRRQKEDVVVQYVFDSIVSKCTTVPEIPTRKIASATIKNVEEHVLPARKTNAEKRISALVEAVESSITVFAPAMDQSKITGSTLARMT